MQDKAVTGARLVIDRAGGAGKTSSKKSRTDRNNLLLGEWRRIFGDESVRYVVNHAKIARVEAESGLRVLLRGSMNLNFNPRFEQLDITEGGPDYDLVEKIENELPILPPSCSKADAYAASRVSEAFEPEQLKIFGGLKVWAK
jgi:hypothetical protein